MTEVIGVRFKKVGKVYYFDPCGIQVKNDAAVIVETARGQEYGEVAMANSQVEDSKIVQPLKKLVRVATEADKKTMEQNLQFEKDAFKVCEEKIQKHKLDMKLVSVETPSTAARSCSISAPTAVWTSGSWSRIWPACSAPVLSCGRSVSGTKPK